MKNNGLLFLFSLILCVSFFYSCRDRDKTEILLNKIEEILSDMPDSALILIERIDEDEIKDENIRAHYFLLKTEVNYKNALDDTDSTEINKAISFYREHHNDEKLMRALYQKTIICFNSRTLNESLVCALEGLGIAERLKNVEYIARFNQEIATLYMFNWNRKLNYEYMHRASEGFKEVGMDRHYIYAKIQEGVALTNLSRYEESNKLLDSVIPSISLEDSSFLCEAYTMKFINDYYLKNREEAFKNFNLAINLESNYFKVFPFYRVRMALWDNDFDEAKNILDRWADNLDEIDKSDYQKAMSMYFKEMGDFEAALNHYEEYRALESVKSKDFLNQGLATTQSEYNTLHAENLALQLKVQKMKTVFYILICIFFLLVAGIIFYVKTKKKNEEINSKINEIVALNDIIKDKNDEFFHLYKQKFSTLKTLAEKFFELPQNEDKERKLIYSQVNAMVKEIREPKFIEQLIADTNKYKNNLVECIKAEFPKMKNNDLYILLYSIAGFPPKAISLIFDISINNVYIKRTRFKHMIKDSSLEEKDELLGMF